MTTPILDKNRFQECETCINKTLDPFQCKACTNASNYEGEDDSEELTYAEFIDFIKDIS